MRIGDKTYYRVSKKKEIEKMRDREKDAEMGA